MNVYKAGNKTTELSWSLMVFSQLPLLLPTANLLLFLLKLNPQARVIVWLKG